MAERGVKQTGARRHLQTVLIHGREKTHKAGEPTLPPVALSASFEHESAEAMEAAFAGKSDGMLYSRLQNPTVQALEQRMAAACDAPGAVAMASGMSAITVGLITMLKAGDELLVSPYLFGGSYTLFAKTLADLGIVAHFVDPRNPAAAEAQINARTRAVFVEAIANPAMVVPPLKAWRALCDQHGLTLLLDATLITPCLYDADAVPADVLFFSTTKYVAGAASTLGGLIVDTGRCDWTKQPGFEDFRQGQPTPLLFKLRKRQMAAVGPCLSPMNAFLMLVGMEALPLRLERQCENAERAAAYLREHPKVRRVDYPGLPDHADHAVSKAQFQGRFGGVLAFELEDKAACFRFLNALELVSRVTNLGDTRTIAVHPASTIYGSLWKHEQDQLGIRDGMIRFSLGIEHIDDILADLDQALQAA